MRDNPSSDHIGDMIDDVARSMTHAEPAPLLRAAVRARIEQPGRVPASWRLAAAAAAVAIAIIGARVLFDRSEAPSAPAQVAFRVEAPPPPAVSAPVVAVAPQRSAGATAARTSAARASETALVAAVTVSDVPISAGDQIVDVQPIAEAALDESPIQLELVETPMPLLAEWVEIEPLSIQ
jgi:hypothetical protein